MQFTTTSAPRLLAYGGTSFSERQRIGTWPPIPLGTLQDRYGLAIDRTVYGVGVLGNEAFLILRQIQNVSNRGGYAYSLLLDPGETIWQRFAWNGAALTQAVLESPEATDALLVNVDRIGPLRLSEVLNALHPPELTISRANDSDLQILWLGVMLSHTRMVVGGRHEPADLARVLNSLPVCFRTGSGWLMSGGEAHGVSLGAWLVWDSSEPDSGSANVASLIAHGRRMLAIWRWIEHEPSTRGLVAEVGQIPVWRWGTDEWGRLVAAVELSPISRRTLGSLRQKVGTDLPLPGKPPASDYFSYV